MSELPRQTKNYESNAELPASSLQRVLKVPQILWHHFEKDITHHYLLGFSAFSALAMMSHSMDLKTFTTIFGWGAISTGVSTATLLGYSHIKQRRQADIMLRYQTAQGLKNIPEYGSNDKEP